MIYSITNKKLTLCVDSFGCQMQSIKNQDGMEFLWQGDPKFWSRRALTLFPFCAGLYDNKYLIDGKEFHMDIHGLAPYYDFEVISHKSHRITFRLCHCAETLLKYPRKFNFNVTFTLVSNHIGIIYEVINLDEKPMYFGVGGHPGFNVPLNSELEFEDYYICFDKEADVEQVVFSSQRYRDGRYRTYPLREGKCIDLRHDIFDSSPLVLRNVPHKVTLKSDKDPHRVTVTYPQMDYLSVWHWPLKNAPYVCIEPWTNIPAREGIIEDFSTKNDLIVLSTGEIYMNNWDIEII